LQLSEVVGSVKVGVYVAGQPSTVVLAPCARMLGGWLSCSVSYFLLVSLVLLHASLAYHVRVNVVVQLSPVVLSLGCSVAPLQLSEVVGSDHTGAYVDGRPSTVALAPCPPINEAGAARTRKL